MASEIIHKYIKKPTPALEPLIAQNPNTAYSYARKILRGRFPAGEPAIATDARCSRLYALYVIRGVFPLGEAAIATDTWESNSYAIRVLKGRFVLGEPNILESGNYCLGDYIRNVIRGRWEAAEPYLVKDSGQCRQYVIHILEFDMQYIDFYELCFKHNAFDLDFFKVYKKPVTDDLETAYFRAKVLK